MILGFNQRIIIFILFECLIMVRHPGKGRDPGFTPDALIRGLWPSPE